MPQEAYLSHSFALIAHLNRHKYQLRSLSQRMFQWHNQILNTDQFLFTVKKEKIIRVNKLKTKKYNGISTNGHHYKSVHLSQHTELNWTFLLQKNSIYLSMNPIYTWILNSLLQLWSPQSIMRSQFPWTCTILERFDDNSCIFITNVIIIIIIMILCKPSSHLSPLKPKGHEHVYPLWWPLQVAPFWHILLWHSSSSSTELQE